ncbi:hypothetical protein A616_16390 [Brevibacillus brevis X23]|nr:hypothetical protein A616_16390 [Brevibacillus brevis X23]
MKEQLLKQIEDLKKIREQVDQMDIDEKSKRQAKSGVSNEIRQLNSKLRTIEQRERTELDTFESNGKPIEIPRGLMHSRDVEYQYSNGVIYQFKKPHLEKDGSFHLHHYIWLDEGTRQTEILVRTLGNDNYGDRYYLSASYYKDKRDMYSYRSIGINPYNKKFKPYVNKVIEYIRKHEGFEDFFKQKTQ